LLAFISHSHEDQSAYSSLCLALDSVSVPCWDVAQLVPGLSLAEQLRRAVELCDVCVFLATRTSIQSKWCLAELGAFWGAGKRVIVYLADPEVKESELPPQLQGNLWTKDARQLVNAVKHAFNESAAQLTNKTIELRTRDQLPKLSEDAAQAKAITLVGASLVSVVISCQTFFQNCLKRGCKLRFVVLDPNCTAVETWNLRTESCVVRQDIERVMINFRLLGQYVQQENQLDIRLLRTIPSYSIISVYLSIQTNIRHGWSWNCMSTNAVLVNVAICSFRKEPIPIGTVTSFQRWTKSAMVLVFGKDNQASRCCVVTGLRERISRT
jgi:hypothetical protein